MSVALHLYSYQTVDNFASFFSKWFAREKNLVEPKFTVWIVRSLIVWRRLRFILPLARRLSPPEHYLNYSLNEGFEQALALTWAFKMGKMIGEVPAVIKKINDLFQRLSRSGDCVIFLCLPRIKKMAGSEFDFVFKQCLVHEIIHSFEYKNNVIFLKGQDVKMVKFILQNFLLDNPQFARPLNLSD